MSAKENKQPEAFTKLLGELETMTKALPNADVADDKKIQAAAAAGGADDDESKDGAPVAEGTGGAAPMTKSFKVTLADGSEVEAEDGTELVKSLIERLDGSEELVAKALGSAINLIKVQGEALKANTELVKSLQAKVDSLSGEGRGRKALLAIHEKPAGTEMTKSEPTGMSTQEFMTKSHAAFDAKKISGVELTVIDVSIRNKHAIDPSLVSKVLA